jgi:hypothetical protein
MKLELKHLAPYLPYSLMVKRMSQIYVLTSDIIARREKNGTLHLIKPILHPLSDITKEIEVNGEKFVPMEILFSLIPSHNYVDYVGPLNHPSYQIDDGWNHCISHGTGADELTFSFTGNSFWLMVGYNIELLDNQLQLFEKLFEWHFDVFNLIPEGLAIDINTL